MKASFTIAAAAAAAVATIVASVNAGSTQAEQSLKPDLIGVVYTADEHGNSISALDLVSGKVTSAPVPISPHNVQITADGTRLLAVSEPAAEGHGHAQIEAGHGMKADQPTMRYVLPIELSAETTWLRRDQRA